MIGGIGIRKRYLGLAVLGIVSVVFILISNPFSNPDSQNLHAQALKAGANVILPGNWQSVSNDFLSIKTGQGIGSWLWEKRNSLQLSNNEQIQNTLQAEGDLNDYMTSGGVTRTFPVMDLMIQFRGTPIFLSGNAQSARASRSLASVSKTITSVGVLLLVQQKQISLDDDIAKYFPEFRHFSQPLHGVPITIRDLLRHTSGISYRPSTNGAYKSKYRNMHYVMAKQYTTAGATFNYSNFNYYILAALVEKISGMGFDRYLQKNLFTPLKMSSTRLSAAGSGAAGIYSTVDDLSTFLTTLFGDAPGGERLLSVALLKEMFKKPDYVKTHPEMMYYGLGIRVQYRSGRLSSVFHTGLWNGVFAEMRYFPGAHASMVHLGAPRNFRAKGVGSYRYQSVALAGKYVKGIHELFPIPSFTKSLESGLVLKNR